MIGLKRHTVKLEPHSDTWKHLFIETKGELAALLGNLVLNIQHIGSTSIDSIKAKPIIDIAILVEDTKTIENLIPVLEDNGFDYRGDGKNEGGHLFVKCSAPEIRTHHIHVVVQRDKQWENFLNFRDKLNSDPELAEEYNALKSQLELKYKENRKEYTKGKNDFITEVLK